MRCFVSVVQQRLGDPPESSAPGVSQNPYPATLGVEIGSRRFVRPPKLLGTQKWGSDLVAPLHTTLPQPIGDWANATLNGPVGPTFISGV